MARTDRLLLIVAIAAVLSLAAVQIVGELAYYPHASHLTNITITATGSAYATPDNTMVYIYANGTGTTTALATSNLSNTLGILNSTLFSYLSGNLSNIQTTSYQLYKAHNSSLYTATESFSVTIPISQAGPVLTSLASIPNVYITNVNVRLSKQQASSLMGQALSSAISNATSQAQQVAGQGARPMLVSVNVNGAYYNSPGIYTPSSANPQIYGGISSVTESVTVKYSYLNALVPNK